MKKESMARKSNKIKLLSLIVGVSVISATGGVFAVQSDVVKAISASLTSDKEWAIQLGYVSATTMDEQTIRQADFLKMVMKEFKPLEPGIIVPPGAENHWAAGIYATAKKEGIIDCSCQVKPDDEISPKEAARFVWLAINRKAGTSVIELETIEKWIEPEKDKSINYGQAIVFIRKLHEKLLNLTNGG